MSEEIPEEWLQGMREDLRQLFWQVELLTRDIARLSDASFSVNEWDSPYEGTAWHISFSVRNTAPLFPSELKALAHGRLPWATNVKVCI